MPPKQRSPDDVHDIFNVQVGKPYRGSMVEKIDIETTDLPSGKVKVRRLIYCESGIILIEDTWHEYGEVYKDGKLLPYDQINFPSMDPSDFQAPVPKKDDDDDDEKKKKRELLRQKAKEMLKPKNVIPDDDEDDNDELRIKVKTPDGEVIPIVVKKDDTIDDLKDKIEDDHGIPVDDCNLNLNGKPFDRPKSTMNDCGVKDGDVLDLDPVDKTFTVCLRTPDGEKFDIDIDPTETVQDLKQMIENDLDVPVSDQSLSCRGKVLNDPVSTMAENGISDGDIIDLDTGDISVVIRRPDGSRFTIPTKADSTVKNLKKLIEKNEGIPVGLQDLVFQGTPLHDQSSTMADNGICDGDIIDLDTSDISVNVRAPDGRCFTIPTKKDSTVNDLKKSIQQKEGIPVKDQNLAFDGTRLEDPTAKMTDLGVNDGDTLELKLNDDDDVKDRKKTKPMSGKRIAPKGNDRKRVLGPDSAWVYPTPASAPKEGEIDNLQGIWSMPPAKGSGTDPVEVNIHPKHKEPKSNGKTDIHGAYGYINGAKPDADGVVDPKNVVFYPPGQKDYSPDFEHIGWWSAPESNSITTISWRFEGDDCLNVKTHTVNVMGHEMTFVKEWVD